MNFTISEWFLDRTFQIPEDADSETEARIMSQVDIVHDGFNEFLEQVEEDGDYQLRIFDPNQLMSEFCRVLEGMQIHPEHPQHLDHPSFFVGAIPDIATSYLLAYEQPEDGDDVRARAERAQEEVRQTFRNAGFKLVGNDLYVDVDEYLEYYMARTGRRFRERLSNRFMDCYQWLRNHYVQRVPQQAL